MIKQDDVWFEENMVIDCFFYKKMWFSTDVSFQVIKRIITNNNDIQPKIFTDFSQTYNIRFLNTYTYKYIYQTFCVMMYLFYDSLSEKLVYG